MNHYQIVQVKRYLENLSNRSDNHVKWPQIKQFSVIAIANVSNTAI